MEEVETLPATAPKTWSDHRLFVLVFAVLFPLFLATSAWTLPYHIDPLTNVYSAASIAEDGSPILHDQEALAAPEAFRVLGWVVDSPRGPVSQYPPGTALFASVGYLFAGEGEAMEMSGSNDPDLAPISTTVPPLWPAAVMASLATALAAAFVALALHLLVGTRWAFVTAVVLAAGTGLWLNGSHELWQHGVSSMWVALGLCAAGRRSWLGSGLALGVGVLTRPPVAIVSSGLGVFSSWRERDWRPVLLHGLGAMVGLAALLAYNFWLWGEFTISGGYSSEFVGRLTDAGPGWYISNLLGGLFSLDRGLFVWSPFIGVALIGIPKVWRELPGWVVGSFLGGVVLLLVQFRLNRYSGGYGFFSYRYPLESVVASAPALAIAAQRLWSKGGLWQRLVLYSAAASVALHAAALVVELRV